MVSKYHSGSMRITYRKLSEATQFRVQEALSCMQNHHEDPHLSLGFVAKQVGVSRCYLSRILTRKTGQHFRALLRGIRMRHATALLSNPALSVKEVSWAVGYGYLSNFDRDFRAEYHTSPIRFRCGRKTS